MDYNKLEEAKKEYSAMNDELKTKISAGYEAFRKKYAPEILRSLSNEELLSRLFLGKNTDNLCYDLEYDSEIRIFGDIRGKPAQKYGLFYKNEAWVSGNNDVLTEEEAIKIGTDIRNLMVEICEYASRLKFDSIEDYEKFEKFCKKHSPAECKLIEETWFRKYLHMIFPQNFPAWYSREILDTIIEYYGDTPSEDLFVKIGQVALIAKQCDIQLCEFANLDTNKSLAASVKKQKSKIHYWIYSPGEKAERWEEFYKDGIMAIGWDDLGDLSNYKSRDEIKEKMKKMYSKKDPKNDSLACWDFANTLKKGDIVFVKKGRNTIVGKGIVKDNYKFDNKRKDYKSIHLVEWIVNGFWTSPQGKTVMKTLTDITKYPDYVKELENLIGEDDKMTNKTTKKQNESNPDLNMILYGPPGTGKTYNTIIEAMKIVDYEKYTNAKNYRELKQAFDEYRKQGRIEFVTFHQSYSYEEFVEGIKPDLEGDSLTYSINVGIFKEICERANGVDVPENNDLGLNANPKVWKVSLKGTGDNEIRRDCMKNNYIRIGYYQDSTDGKRIFSAFADKMDIGDIVISCYSATTFDAIGVVKGEYKLSEDFDDYKSIRDVRWLVKDIEDNILEINNGKRLVQGAVYQLNIDTKDVLDIINKHGKKEIEYKAKDKPYVLIIDEINRGNISKIFGELITLIEPDKRIGDEHEMRVTLPYTKDLFGVPKNLYIIGTMNTSDRSIASVDIALRRRFKFKEMMPRIDLVADFGIGFSKIFEKLNTKIKLLLDRDHQIGHSYFINTKYNDENGNNNVDTLKEIWFNEIIPLLNEYFYCDWEKLKLVIPGFIRNIYGRETGISDAVKSECDGNNYEFRTYSDEDYDFEAALKQSEYKEKKEENKGNDEEDE